MNPLSLIISNSNSTSKDIGLYRCKKKIHFNELHEIQSISKEYINKCPNWNKLKQRNENNLYNKKNDINNIIKIDMCSRSFLKLIEMYIKFDLCKEKQINYLALAEAPGGFIEAFMALRKKKFMGRNDNIVTVSLFDESDNGVPKYIFKNKHNFNVKTYYGRKGNGDLYDVDNILSIDGQLNGKRYNFVTADGGLDFSKDFNNQEKLIFKLLFIETITALMYLEDKGTFILKIFDILNQNTMELLYIISIFFERVVIYKPYLSRNSNSEKYLVCTGFKGITKTMLEKLLLIYKVIDTASIDNYSLVEELPAEFIGNLFNYNKTIIENQVSNIIKTILEVNNYEKILSNFNWCKQYDINNY